MRTQLANIQGASFPLPYGGKPRQIMVDLDPQALFAHGLSASDVTAALNTQSLILPTGSAKIGTREYRVEMNNSPGPSSKQFNQHSDQDRQRHHHLSCTTSPRFATASRGADQHRAP